MGSVPIVTVVLVMGYRENLRLEYGELFSHYFRLTPTAGLPTDLCKCGGSAPPFPIGGFIPAFNPP